MIDDDRGPETEYDEKRKRVKKYTCCVTVFVLISMLLIISGSFVPKLFDTLISAGAKKSAQLSQENEADWRNIPGTHDIGIYWNQYFYNCTNAEAVVYTNAQPEYQEFGPYIYREFDNYNDLNYTNLDNMISQESLPAVFNKFTIGNTYKSDGDGLIDTPMYLTNQALFGVWYQQNFAASQPEKQWQVYLTLLYSAVQDGLGRQVIQQGAWQQMAKQQFGDVAKINNNFLHNNKVSDQVANAMYTDPWYGLQDFNNYYHWDNLVYTTDEVKRQEQLAWIWELRTYFGLSNAQILEMQENWNTYYTDQTNIVMESIPSAAPYDDQTGVAYWQWADSYMTQYKSDPAGPSVLNSTDTVTGYVEYWFWLNYYCNPENQGAMSAENWAVFQNVNMYNSKSDSSANFEYLFTLTDPTSTEANTPPGEASLFNLTTLQTLVNLGHNTKNIIMDEGLVYGDNFELQDDWSVLGTTLNLGDPADPESDIAAKRAYMIYLWMNTTWYLTFEQQQNGGNAQIGVIGTLGATAFYETMTTMQLEFPMFVMAEQMSYDYKTEALSCEQMYTTKLSLTADQATALCTTSQNFTYADSFNSSVALTNVYLYQDGFNSFYYNEFLNVTGMTAQELNQTMYSSDSQFETYYFGSILPQVKQNVAGFGTCDGTILTLSYCSFSNLTYNQWLNNTVLANPTTWQEEMGFAKSTGYVQNFEGYATGWINPEYGYWKNMNNMPGLPERDYQDATDLAYFNLSMTGLYNGKKFQDVLLYPQKGYLEYPKMDEYLRFVTINFGLSGLLTVRTPREMIEGYNDPLVEVISSTPIYMGGDATTSPFLALNNPPTHPTNNTVAFFTGQDDYEMTRVYGQWLSQEYIMMKGKQYTNMYEMEDYLYSPWEEEVMLDGTDGMQFSPALTEDSILKAFVNDLSRNCYFDYSHNDDTYPHLDNYIYKIQYALMANLTENPANTNYQVKITGTTNMTTSLNAWGFAAKGHYYQLADVVSSSKPVIRDSNGKEIAADPDGDDTFLGVEPTTGVCLQALERIFFNMQIFGDDLFRNFSPPIPEEYGYFFPLAYVKRESAWTQNQVDEVFGALVLGQKIKLALCIIMLVIGAILLGLGGFYGWKLYKERKELEEMEPESTVPKVDTVDHHLFGTSTTDRQRRRDVDGSVNSEEGLFNSQVKKDKKKKSKQDKNDSDSDDFRDFRESKRQGKPLLTKEY